MIVLGGLPFSFEPEKALSPDERAALLSLSDPGPAPAGERPVFRIALEARPSRPSLPSLTAPAPARLTWEAGRLLVHHAHFEAEVYPEAGEAVVRREANSALALVTTLRMALSSRLPLLGGLVLHAAGLEREGQGLVFFGPAGIGKTSLAARSPWPVLSDELVALLPREGQGPYRISGTPFRKPSTGSARPSTPSPRLWCLVEIAQGAQFGLERLEPAAALRGLLASIAVPPGPPLWSAALGVVGRLTRDVPCYRMAWSLDAPPFDALADALQL